MSYPMLNFIMAAMRVHRSKGLVARLLASLTSKAKEMLQAPTWKSLASFFYIG